MKFFLSFLLVAQSDTIFGTKLKGVEVQEFVPNLPQGMSFKFDSFTVYASGEWIFLKAHGKASAGPGSPVIIAGDIICSKIKGVQFDSAKVSPGVFFIGFEAEGPDPQGFISLYAKRSNGTRKAVIRSKLKGIKFDNFWNPNARIKKFTVSGPDANGFVWLLCELEPMEKRKGGNVMEERVLPKLSFGLKEISPNPASSYIRIFYTVDEKIFVSLSIYDKNGRLIKNIMKEVCEPGIYNISWGMVDERGKRVKSGEYFVVFEGGKKKETKKVLIIE